LIVQAGVKYFSGRFARRAGAVIVSLAVTLFASTALAASAEAAPTTITEFPVEVGHPSNLEALFVGSNGNVWFNDYWWPEGAHHSLIGRMDEEGNVAEFDKGLSKYSSPDEFVTGPDGNVWFADDGGAAIGRITPAGTITEYSTGLGASRPNTIVLGPDGNLWFTATGESPAVGFATTGGKIGAFGLPGPPRDAVGGPDGNIWFTYRGKGVAPAIGRVVRQEGGTTIITLFHAGLNPGSEPAEIVAAQNGYLWFSDRSNTTPAIGRVSSSGEIKEFSVGLSAESGLWDMAAGTDGNVWFTDRDAGAVGRITPEWQITEFGSNVLSSGDGPRYITAGPDGNMWFTYGGGGPPPAIGKISASGAITLLHDGLGSSARPTEISSGPDGELWFIAKESESPAIGRIIPGDDNPPPTSGPESPPGHSISQLVLQKGKIRVSRGRVHVRLACQSSTVCAGELRLTIYHRNWRTGRLAGSSLFSLEPGITLKSEFRLSFAARKLLQKTGHQRAQLSVRPDSSFLAAPVRVLLVWP
jgi:streptogramin lyase